MDAYLKYKQLLTDDNLLNTLLSDKYTKDIDSKFDLNSCSEGIYRSWGSKPINSPDKVIAWAKYWCITLYGPAKLMIVIDTNGSIFYRTSGGSPVRWNDWKQIGGVTDSLLNHTRQAFSRLLIRKAVAC